MTDAALDRIPPQDLAAEAAVLSAILLEQDALDRVVDILAPETFYSEPNRRVFESACELARKGTPIDIVSVAGNLRDRDRLVQVGGARYLAELADAVPAVAHLPNYAKRVREKWRMRMAIETAQRYAATGYGFGGDAQEFLDQMEVDVYNLARSPEHSTVAHIADAVRTAFNRISEASKRGDAFTGISTGFERLDMKLAGLHGGELTITAARPGMGKTSFMLDIALAIARQGLCVFIWSGEMPKEQLAIRLIFAMAAVDSKKARLANRLTDGDWAKLTIAAGELTHLPIWIDDRPGISVLEFRAKARRLASEAARAGRRMGLVALDYLQLMHRDPRKQREEAVSDNSASLKRLSTEMNLPVMALSQLNRAVESRGKDKRPQLSDLRESGAVEQDADNVLFIHREDYYRKPGEKKDALAEIIVAKQRNGPTGRVFVRWFGACSSFGNLQPGDGPDEDKEEEENDQ